MTCELNKYKPIKLKFNIIESIIIDNLGTNPIRNIIILHYYNVKDKGIVGGFLHDPT